MFVNTGSRKVKPYMSVMFDYDSSNHYYSRKEILHIISNIRNDMNGASDYFMEATRRSKQKFLSFFSEKNIRELLINAQKYDGVVLFSYDSPNKKEKKHKVNFYIVPRMAYGYIRESKNEKYKPYSNEKVYLLSDAILPNEMVGSNGVKNIEEEKRVKIKSKNSLFKSIKIKTIFNEIYDKTVEDFSKEIEGLEHGLHDASLDGVNHFLYIDREFTGNKDKPGLILIEHGFYNKKDLNELTERGIYKK